MSEWVPVLSLVLSGRVCTDHRPRMGRSGRVLPSARYARWMRGAVGEVAVQRRGVRVAEACSVSVVVESTRSPVAVPDVDNLAKSVLDALVKSGALEDDRYVVELTARKARSGRDRVEVVVMVGRKYEKS